MTLTPRSKLYINKVFLRLLPLNLSRKTWYNWLVEVRGNKQALVSFSPVVSVSFPGLAVNLHFQTVYAFRITIIILKIFSECVWLIYCARAPAQKRRADPALVNIKKKHTRIDKREKLENESVCVRIFSIRTRFYPISPPALFFIAPMTVFLLNL